MEFGGGDDQKRWIWGLFALAFAGFLFSGYLSAVKFFSNTCAFNEPCPYFWGYPACWYGFGMYSVMFVVTALALARGKGYAAAIKTNLAVSALGIIFAGSFAFQELVESRITGALGLSTCAYGLIFYIAIFVVSIIALQKSRSAGAEAGAIQR